MNLLLTIDSKTWTFIFLQMCQRIQTFLKKKKDDSRNWFSEKFQSKYWTFLMTRFFVEKKTWLTELNPCFPTWLIEIEPFFSTWLWHIFDSKIWTCFWVWVKELNSVHDKNWTFLRMTQRFCWIELKESNFFFFFEDDPKNRTFF